ncbi:MAG: type VI secretion system-associated protein TagF, partial [Xanthomonadaceae bacterium]|nr:type VI secretion system-associated protein TagF [Xanthomonadaceae bacterium]
GDGVTVDKALELPLPHDPLYRRFVATFWLDMISNFVSRGDFELVIMMVNGDLPRLIVGFNGADYQSLRAVMDPDAGNEHLIRLDRSEWAEEYVTTDYNLNKYVSYLDRNDLSLKTSRRLFGETFLGV